MNIFKVFTQNGRRNLVREILDEELTEENVATLVGEQLTKVLTNASLAEDKAKKVAAAVTSSTGLVQSLFKAAEDGVISMDEAKSCIDQVFKMFNTTFAAVLTTVKDTIVAKIP